MSISEEHMSVQRYLQCTLWYQKHPLDRLQQADSPDIQAVCLKLEGLEAEPAKRIQDTSRCHKMELQDLHIQEDYSEDNELEEAIWKLYQTKQT